MRKLRCEAHSQLLNLLTHALFSRHILLYSQLAVPCIGLGKHLALKRYILIKCEALTRQILGKMGRENKGLFYCLC